MTVRHDGMLPAAWVEGFNEELAKWPPTPPWLERLRDGLAKAAASYENAASRYDQLLAAHDAVRTLLPAFDALMIDTNARQLFVRIMLSINMMSVGRQSPLLHPIETNGGRSAGREHELVQCSIVYASIARQQCGMRKGVADTEVAEYARRRGIKRHDGDLITPSTVRDWRLATNAHKLPRVRLYVDLRLKDLIRNSPPLDQVRRETEFEIDFLASSIITKIPS